MTKISLNKFIRDFGSRIKIDNDNYPHADLSTRAQAEAFIVDHGLKHLMKSAGAIARISEAVDHGEPLDKKALTEKVANAMVTLANLAHKFDISAEDLYATADRVMRSK